jgi:hypothetical protein
MPSSRNDYPSANANLTVPALSPRLVSSRLVSSRLVGTTSTTTAGPSPVPFNGRAARRRRFRTHTHVSIHRQESHIYPLQRNPIVCRRRRTMSMQRARAYPFVFFCLWSYATSIGRVRASPILLRSIHTYTSSHIPCHAMPTCTSYHTHVAYQEQ